MITNPFRSGSAAKSTAAVLLVICPFLAVAQETKASATPVQVPGGERQGNPLPADAHTSQTIQLDGKALPYKVTGTLPVFDKGKKAGEIVWSETGRSRSR